MPFAPAALSVFLAGSVAASAPDDGLSNVELPPAETVESAPAKKEKRWSVARDFAGLFPVGELADNTGPMGGPLARLGFQATTHLELGVRGGFLHGLEKQTSYGTSAMSGVPVLASARWFALPHHEGPYLGVEFGTNILRRRHEYDATARARTPESQILQDRTRVYVGGNIAIGVVVSKTLPIDLRFQASALDLVGNGKPFEALAIGGTAGYTIYF